MPSPLTLFLQPPSPHHHLPPHHHPPRASEELTNAPRARWRVAIGKTIQRQTFERYQVSRLETLPC